MGILLHIRSYTVQENVAKGLTHQESDIAIG